MTDERLQELRDDYKRADDERVVLKRKLEDSKREIQRLSSECTRLNEARKQLAEPYKLATERVADLSSQIRAEEDRRAEEEAARKQSEREAAKRAEEPAPAAQAE